MLELFTAAAAGVYSVARFCSIFPTRTVIHPPPRKRTPSHYEAMREVRLSRMGYKGNNKYTQYLASAHWKLVISKVRHSRKYVCMACGTTVQLNLHHITYDRIGHENMENLVWLCDKHHGEAHTIERRTGNLLIAHRLVWQQRARTGLKTGPWC
jgi:hypothetical protein